MASMRTLIHLLLLVVSARASIDSIIAEVEEEYDREVSDGVSGKAPRPAWDEYRVPNRSEEFVKYQLDMIINKQQFKELVEGFSEDGSRRKRNAVFSSKLWLNRTIPYEIDPNFEFEERYKIMVAIQHVMRHTCVVFKPHEQETNYVMFIRIASGCESPVGMLDYENPINLAVPGCMSKAVLVHEIGHSLGLYHEHMRHDRDKHLLVRLGNVTQGKKSQFRLLKAAEYDDFGKPYDYRSLMHYGKNYYGKTYEENNVTRQYITLEPTLPEYLDVIGEAPGLSFHDIQILNDMYKCADNCQQKECLEGQFLGKNCQCYCRGTPENAAVPCEQQASCHLPADLDPALYYAFKLPYETDIIITDNLPIPSGQMVEVRFLNKTLCGNERRQAKCDNGEWDAEVKPPCVKERCKLDPNWYLYYFVTPTHSLDEDSEQQTELPHHEEVDLACLDANITVNLFCNNGSWEGQLFPCEGKNCTVKYDLGSRFDYVQAGQELKSGTEVAHGEIVNATCRVMPEEGSDVTSVTCNNGEWIGEAPADCLRDGALCPVIPDAKVRSHENEAHRYQVTCLDGYDLVEALTRDKINIGSFTCDKVGNWRPNTPVCYPAPCSVPTVQQGYVKDRDGKHAPSGTFVASGDHVTLTCRRGHAPDTATVTCKLGKWDNGPFPICEKVECDPPSVSKAKYWPEKDVYMYKDIVNVGRCRKNNHQFLGNRTLTCLRTGQWSGEARCQNYCEDGNASWTHFSGMRASKKGRRHIATDFRHCQEACQIQKGFLCLSISFGFPPPHFKPQCRLHKLDLHNSSVLLTDDIRWVAATRSCSINHA